MKCPECGNERFDSLVLRPLESGYHYWHCELRYNTYRRTNDGCGHKWRTSGARELDDE